MGVKVQSIISKGSKGTIVDIECHLSNNLPTIVIVGSASKAVDEARERIRGAFATSHLMLPRKRITLNLAPADIPKADSSFDLAMAVSILIAGGEITTTVDPKTVFIGELGLDGSTRAVRGIIGKILLGRARGISTFFIPFDNLKQAQLVPKVNLVPIRDLRQIYNYLTLAIPIKNTWTGKGKYVPASASKPSTVYLSEVVGQEQAKKALEIAAAGGHNLFMHGPPGTGKSLLAKALSSIMPALSLEEMLEVTHLHSLAGHDYDQLVTERPFRAPHHSASYAAMVGGGAQLRPGEISLAHRGVLFLDEFPEFQRETLEALRQPLEDKVINVVRVNESADFPANFILVATANPCPCGFRGTDACNCLKPQVDRYEKRLSGPLLDRIDLFCEVGVIDHQKLLSQSANPAEDTHVIKRVIQARRQQLKRFGTSGKLNADMTREDIKQLAHISTEAKKLLNEAGRTHNLSARGYIRIAKVARTIADLEDSTEVTLVHMSNAIHYRLDTLTKPQE